MSLDRMEIILDITDKCNFNCRYCFHRQPLNQIKSLFNRHTMHNTKAGEICRRLESFPGSTIFFTGGEPFLHPEFVSLCMQMSKRHKIDICTNLSCPSVDDFASKVNPKSVQNIQVTYHPAEIKRYGLQDVFFNRLDLLKNKGFKHRVFFIMHPEYSDMYMKCRFQFSKLGFALLPKYFIGTYRLRDYPMSHNEKEEKLIRKYAADEEKITFRGLNLKGSLCRAGQNFAWIDDSGNVRRCFGDPTYLGNIFQDYSLFSAPKKCKARHHYCPDVCLRHVML